MKVKLFYIASQRKLYVDEANKQTIITMPKEMNEQEIREFIQLTKKGSNQI